MNTRTGLILFRLAATAVVVLVVAVGSGATYAQSPQEILDQAGVKGGLVVHLGCGDGRLTAALRVNDRYLVHGLDTDAGNVEKAREHLHSLGIYGKVSLNRLRGERLPYVDNLVNLLVAEDPDTVPIDEVMRVLAPGGVAYVKRNGQWTKAVKPRPEEIDQWTHFLHDATGNAVANDSRVGPPRHMQWLAEPMWSRNHHILASTSALVSTERRVFQIVDEGTSASTQIPSKWFLAARDAFNGVLLWKRPIPTWAYHLKRFRSGPVQLPRLLVAEGDRVYAPLGISAAVSILDAASGQVIRTCQGTEHAEEIILDDGLLFVVTGSPISEQAAVDPAWSNSVKFPNQKSIIAVRAFPSVGHGNAPPSHRWDMQMPHRMGRRGRVLWKWSEPDDGKLMPLTLAAADRRVYFAAAGGVFCLDAQSGEELWRWSSPAAAKPDRRGDPPPGSGKTPRKRSFLQRSVGWSVATLVVHDDLVLYADGRRLSALSADSGEALWECPSSPGFRSPVDVFVIGGLIWLGPDFSEGRDPRSGEVKRTNTTLRDLRTAGHHHRCYREKATCRYILSNHRGIELVDLVADNHSRNNWIRGVCQYGVMPSNGLIYAPAHACGCFMEGKLYGFWAVAPQRARELTSPSSQQPRLEHGPAYTQLPTANSSLPTDGDWPTYRHDPLRSGSTTSKLPAQLGELWQADVGGQITPPVVAEGLVLIASVDLHRVVALDARDGNTRWTFSAGGRIDSPPTVYRGRVLFGCSDGWVYCLRASDGQLAWRFRAAPQERCTVARGQIESVWPVHGSVLVEHGVAYVAAGRYSYLDGGISLYGLDPLTGKVLCEGSVRGTHPESTEGASDTAAEKIDQNAVDSKTLGAPDRSDAFSMSAARSDVLASDGDSIFLRHLRFDRNWVEQETKSRHLFSTSRLLDGEENHRSHWVLGTGDFSRMPVAYSWIANAGGVRKDFRLAVPFGLMLTFDDQTVWGVRRGSPYRLFSAENRPFSSGDEPLADFRKTDNATGKASAWTWSVDLAMRPRAMVRAGDRLVLGGVPNVIDPNDPYAAYEGRKGGLVWVMSAGDGGTSGQYRLPSPPVWDGMAVAAGRLYLSTSDGSVLSMGKNQ